MKIAIFRIFRNRIYFQAETDWKIARFFLNIPGFSYHNSIFTWNFPEIYQEHIIAYLNRKGFQVFSCKASSNDLEESISAKKNFNQPLSVIRFSNVAEDFNKINFMFARMNRAIVQEFVGYDYPCSFPFCHFGKLREEYYQKKNADRIVNISKLFN